MYYLFNKKQYLGCYVININLTDFVNTFAINYNLKSKDISLYTCEDFDGSGKIVKYELPEIKICEMQEKEIEIVVDIFDENYSDLSQEEKDNIILNKIAIEGSQELPSPWPTRKIKQKQLSEVVIQALPLTKII